MKNDIGAIQQQIQSSIWSHRYIGNYEIVRKIGEGSFSTVYLAVHIMTKLEVVLKSSEKFHSNLASEIASMSLVIHPHVVRLYEYIVMPDMVWLVLEYCGGEELFNHLVMSKVILPDQANRLFAQLAGAVAYVHQLNCAHRDLKLENVLLDENGDIKLADFGFTRSYVPRTMLETICGTESYMAPELVLRKKYNPEAADVWSLGVILYAMIYGKLPFDEDNTVDTVNKIVEQDPPFPHVPKGEHLVEIARKMLRKQANQRPKIIDILDELKDPGKQQKQLLVKIMRHPESSYIFSSREERTVLKGMKALSIDLHSMASSIVHHKCDPLHGLWYTALDKQRALNKPTPEASNSPSMTLRRRKSRASIRSSRSHVSQKMASGYLLQDHEADIGNELKKSTTSLNQDGQYSDVSKSLLVTPMPQERNLSSERKQQDTPLQHKSQIFQSEVLTKQQQAQTHAQAHSQTQPQNLKHNGTSFGAKPTVQSRINDFIERRSVGRSRRAMDRLVSALKFKRHDGKDTLIAYYDPSKDQREPLRTSTSNTSNILGSASSMSTSALPQTSSGPPRGDGQTSSSSFWQGYRQVSSPVLDLGKGSPSSSRRHSTLSLASSSSIPLSDTPLKNNGSGTYGFVASASALMPSQSAGHNSQSQYNSTANGSSSHAHPMKRQMSTYSQISQLSQLSQSSVEASQLLSEATDSPLSTSKGPLASSASRWPNSVLAKKFAGIAQPSFTSSPTSTPPGTPLMSRQRQGRLISVKEKIPSKIDEGDNENE